MLKISLDSGSLEVKPQRPHKGSSVIDFPAEYIGIDVETTGLDYEFDEIIEIAALHVKDGVIVDRFSSLVQPSSSKCIISYGRINKLGYESFADVPRDVFEALSKERIIPETVINLTHITDEMVRSAPLAEAVMPAFCEFIGDHILVGHNAHFDINFIYDACQRCGQKLENDFIDTMRISKKVFPELEHHRLPDIVKRLEITRDIAHRAEADADATVRCFEEMKKIALQSKTIDEFREEFRSRKSKTYWDSLLAITADTDDFDETHPLYGQYVVFTGALSTMGRKEAFQIVANLGGHPENTITKKTNFLVIGNDEFRKSRQDGETQKMKKARAYREKGQDIVTLSESTFFQMLELNEREGTL